MKFTLSEIYGLTRSLQKITSRELPIKISYRICRFLKDCSVEMEILEKERVKLVEKYSEPKEEGKETKVSDENTKKFQEEFSILLAETIDLEFEPICIDDLGDINISTNDLVSMQKMFIEK